MPGPVSRDWPVFSRFRATTAIQVDLIVCATTLTMVDKNNGHARRDSDFDPEPILSLSSPPMSSEMEATRMGGLDAIESGDVISVAERNSDNNLRPVRRGSPLR
jgi:hypothetical protein